MLSQAVDLVLQSKILYLFHKSGHDNKIACQVYMSFITESCRPMYILKVIEKKICFQKSYQNYGMWQICYFTSRIKYDNYAKFCTVLKNLQYDYF